MHRLIFCIICALALLGLFGPPDAKATAAPVQGATNYTIEQGVLSWGE